MSTDKSTETVVFLCREDDTPAELVLHALHGVCAALDAEQFDLQPSREDIDRAGGLALAARILAKSLVNRLGHAPLPEVGRVRDAA